MDTSANECVFYLGGQKSYLGYGSPGRDFGTPALERAVNEDVKLFPFKIKCYVVSFLFMICKLDTSLLCVLSLISRNQVISS